MGKEGIRIGTSDRFGRGRGELRNIPSFPSFRILKVMQDFISSVVLEGFKVWAFLGFRRFGLLGV